MVNIAGSNHGASSAYTEAGPPEMMIALEKKKNISTQKTGRATELQGNPKSNLLWL